MSAIVIEQVKVGDLPEDWRERLHAAADARVTVGHVEAYVRKLRAPRF